jgi:hypothetical protein
MRLRARPAMAAALAAVLAIAGPGGRAAAAPVPSVLRTAGDVSPLGWPYSGFSEGIVDAGGHLVFVGNSTAIFGRQGGLLVRRIGAGAILPDSRRVVGVGPPALAADGCVFARATFDGGGEAIVRACGAAFAVVIDAGTPAPGGGTIRAFDPVVAVAGATMVGAAATITDGTVVLLRHDGSTLADLARSGSPAPTGGTYATLRLLGVTSAGQVGYRASVSGGPNGLFSANETGTRAVAVVGQGSPAGGSFTTVDGGSVHPSGRWAFRASLSDQGSGVFAVDAVGPVTLVRTVVLQGDPLPIAGATVRSFPASTVPSIDAAGAVAFRALIEGATEPPRPSGLFVAAVDRTIAKVATVREEFPGIGTISRLRDPLLADDGSVLVSATVTGVGPGLFVGRAGGLAPLARLGDATDADTGDSRFRFGPAAVTATSEGAAFLGQRDAIFRADAGGAVAALAYTGGPTPLGGVMAFVGSPAVDAAGGVFFGADLQGAQFNEALLVASASGVDTLVAPDRRLLGGGGIRELFPTGVDALARPAGAASGVVFTAALQGARASEAVFLAKNARRARALARAGQRAGGRRLVSLGTPAVGERNAIAFLAEIGDDRQAAVVARRRGGLALVARVGGATRARLEGAFAELGPPAVAKRGTVFRAALDTAAQEGVFIGGKGRVGVVAGSGDATTTGARLRTFEDPVAIGEEVWFLARVAGSVAPAGLYRTRVSRIPKKTDPPLEVEPVLVPGDPAPAPLGGVVVRIDAPRVGPSGVVSVVAGIGGGAAASAILQFVPALP